MSGDARCTHLLPTRWHSSTSSSAGGSSSCIDVAVPHSIITITSPLRVMMPPVGPAASFDVIATAACTGAGRVMLLLLLLITRLSRGDAVVQHACCCIVAARLFLVTHRRPWAMLAP